MAGYMGREFDFWLVHHFYAARYGAIQWASPLGLPPIVSHRLQDVINVPYEELPLLPGRILGASGWIVPRHLATLLFFVFFVTSSLPAHLTRLGILIFWGFLSAVVYIYFSSFVLFFLIFIFQ